MTGTLRFLFHTTNETAKQESVRPVATYKSTLINRDTHITLWSLLKVNQWGQSDISVHPHKRPTDAVTAAMRDALANTGPNGKARRGAAQWHWFRIMTRIKHQHRVACAQTKQNLETLAPFCDEEASIIARIPGRSTPRLLHVTMSRETKRRTEHVAFSNGRF